MDNIIIKKHKYFIWIGLFSINAILSTLVTIYDKYWYAFIILLGLSSVINSINVLLIIINKIYKYNLDNSENLDNLENNVENHPTAHFIYIIPCYNETESEINNTLHSILNQKKLNNDTKKLIIICDGKIPRSNNNEKRTDEVLVDIIFKDYIKNKYILEKAYKTWDNKWNDLDIYTGDINKLDFIIIIKTYNIGKRDSLTLIRRMVYYHNIKLDYINKTDRVNNIDNVDNIDNIDIYLDYKTYFSIELIKFIDDNLYCINTNTSSNSTQHIDFLIGTDADTILDKNCAYELINSFKTANTNKSSKTYNTVVGVVGLVDVVKYWNPLVIYQYCEYLYAQFLRRFIQSKITFKVNCLSGCVQLIKV
jgi:chitin synthase